MSERLYLTADNRKLPRAAYVAYLEECAKLWERVADGSFYGIERKQVDAAALEQAARVRAKATEIAAAA